MVGGGGGGPATDYFLFCFHRKQNLKQRRLRALVVVDVGLHVLGCRVDILGTNCKKLLKLKMSGGGGGGEVPSASVRVIMSGRRQGAYCWIKDILSLGVHFTADKKKRRPPAHGCKWPVMRAAYI